MAKDKWIQKTNVDKPGHKGQLHRDLGVPQGQKIPENKLKEAEARGGKVAERAHFAENMKGNKKR